MSDYIVVLTRFWQSRILGVIVLMLPFLLASFEVASASEWQQDRSYGELAIDSGDSVRYGGYTEDGVGYVDVLDSDGNTVRTLRLPTPAGYRTHLYDLDAAGDLLVVSYVIARLGGDPFVSPNRFALSLFRGGHEIARGIWGGHPYASTGKVALNDDSVFVSYADSGVPDGPFVIPIVDVPPALGAADAISDFAPIPVDWDAGFDGDRYPGAVDVSASNEYLYLYYSGAAGPGPYVDVYSLPQLVLTRSVSIAGLDGSEIEAADDAASGRFAVSGGGCTASLHATDGSLSDCFPTTSGGPWVGPVDIDACDGIVVADADAGDGILVGFKFIPSARDPGCFVDSLQSTFREDIQAIGRSGTTRGCNPPDNDRYCPDDYVTRGQMAAFMVRAMGYSDDGGGDLFEDDDDSIFETDIDKLATAGVTKGCNPPDNDRYCPDDYVTRGQMAAFMVRAMGGS